MTRMTRWWWMGLVLAMVGCQGSGRTGDDDDDVMVGDDDDDLVAGDDDDDVVGDDDDDMRDAGPGPDVVPPDLFVAFPPGPAATEARSVTLVGTAADDRELLEVRVDGELADSDDGFATWTAEVDVAPGDNSFAVVAIDGAGNEQRGTARLYRIGANIVTPFSFEEDPSNPAVVWVVDRLYKGVLRYDLDARTITEVSVTAVPTGVGRLPPEPLPFENPIGIAVDRSDGSRVFVTDRIPNEVLAVDTATGARTVISDGSTGAGPAFDNPTRVIHDAVNDRLFVLEGNIRSIYTVDIATGDRAVLTSPTVPNATNDFGQTVDMIHDVAGNRLLVADRVIDGVVAVDLDTGARTIVSSAAVGTGPTFRQPLAMGADFETGEVFVYDVDLSSVIAVSLVDGSRTLVSDDVDRGSGPRTRDVRDIVVEGERLLLIDNTFDRVVAVDRTTGDRSVVLSREFPVGPNDGADTDLFAVDEARRQLLFAPRYDQVEGLDLVTGDRSVLAGADVPPGAEAFDGIYGGVLSPDGDEILVLDGDADAVVAVSLETGTRRIVADNDGGESPDTAISSPLAIAWDDPRDRWLVLVESPERILAVDEETGDKTLLSGPATPSSDNALDDPRAMVVDGDVAYVADDDLDAIIAVDLLTGARTIYASNDVGTGAPIDGPRSLVLGPTGRYLVAAGTRTVVIDRTTGDRTPLVSPGMTPLAPGYLEHVDALDPGIVLASDGGSVLAIDGARQQSAFLVRAYWARLTGSLLGDVD